MSGWRWRDMPHRLAESPRPHTQIPANERPRLTDSSGLVVGAAIIGGTRIVRAHESAARP